MQGRLKSFSPLRSPYIKVDATVIMNGTTNGRNNIPGRYLQKYIVAPSAKKIAIFVKNQIFGSDLMTQIEGLDIGWLTPTLQESIESAAYQREVFVYIHNINNKIYLQVIGKNCIHDLKQDFDVIRHAVIEQEFDYDEDTDYLLRRDITLENGKSYLKFKAFELSRKSNKEKEIPLEIFNRKLGKDYKEEYVLPYECLINIDIGQDFFKDSEKLLNEEMEIINIIADEADRTKTRVVTSQHYQTNDLVTNWKPASNHYTVETLSVGKIADFFTLLPGDRDDAFFEFLQADFKIEKYIEAFKFYDYQVIQNSGLSPASFGYEKDAYMNVDNVNLAKNPTDMTIEGIKKQLEPQINKLILNIVIAQQVLGININTIPQELTWDYGPNEKFDDMKKIQVLNRLQNVVSIPYKYRAQIASPILKKMIDGDVTPEDMIKENDAEEKKSFDAIKFGEI